jgi:predicted ATPase
MRRRGQLARLAVNVLERASRFVGGRWFVDLTGGSSSDRIDDELGSAIGAPRGIPIDAYLGDVAADGPLLLLLDNCEHVLDGVVAVADRLLGSCPA